MYITLSTINRSLKANICKDWEDCVLDSRIIASMTKPSTRTLIVEWVVKAHNYISVEVVVDSWKHGT